MCDALTYADAHLKGAKRRIFMAETVCSIGEGGQRTVEKVLGWNRGTIRKGMHELQSGIHCIDNFSARGRKLSEEHLPDLLEDITAIVKPSCQTDPTFRTTKLYTPLTAKNVHKRLLEQKKYTAYELPTIRTISTKLDILNFSKYLIPVTIKNRLLSIPLVRYEITFTFGRNCTGCNFKAPG